MKISLSTLPLSVSHWLGYRSPDKVYKPPPIWRIWMWSFLGAWMGICVLEVVFIYGTSFEHQHVPMIIGSFGASAVLLYGAIDAPLSQPRNVFGGHLIGSLVGVILNILLQQLPHFASSEQKEAVRWVTGATAVALTVIIMQITKTVHPPAGATAVLAVVQDNVVEIGWLYIGIVVLSATLQLVLALFINNIERRYPMYWWEPSPPLPNKQLHKQGDLESNSPAGTLPTKIDSGDDLGKEQIVTCNSKSEERSRPSSCLSSISTQSNVSFTGNSIYDAGINMIPGKPLLIPGGLLSEEEEEQLRQLHHKMTEHWHSQR